MTPLDYRIELSATEQILVDVIRSSPTWVLDRSSYALRCINRGMNQHTFSVYLTYSAVTAHVSTDIWTLRGLQVDPAAVEALRAANAEQPREKRVLDYGWTPEGRLWVGVRLPDSKKRGILYLSDAICHALFGGGWRVLGPFPRAVFHPEISESQRTDSRGATGHFWREAGPTRVIFSIVEFDLSEHTALLRLGDDEDLEKLDP